MSEHISALCRWKHSCAHTRTWNSVCYFKKRKCRWLGHVLQFQMWFFSFLPLRFSSPDFDTSILPICKDSLGWMFNKLDMNFDLLLDQSELSAIYLDKYELCMKPLFNSCDSFKDGKLSNNEWCYCFQKPDGEERGMKDRGIKEGRNIWISKGMKERKLKWHRYELPALPHLRPVTVVLIQCNGLNVSNGVLIKTCF